MELFKTLRAPALEEMDGEYDATLLRQTSLRTTLLARFAVRNPLLPVTWKCKAFRPISGEEGRGYNGFDVVGRCVRRFPMKTRIAPSRFDGRDAYQLDYRGYRSFCADIHMLDEVRQYADGLYLGIGTCGLTPGQRRVPLPFLLRGPSRAYLGDIGIPAII
jgi:hypothetical protein